MDTLIIGEQINDQLIGGPVITDRDGLHFAVISIGTPTNPTSVGFTAYLNILSSTSPVTRYGFIWNQGTGGMARPEDGTRPDLAGYSYYAESPDSVYSDSVGLSTTGMTQTTIYKGRGWVLNKTGYSYTYDEFTITTGSYSGGGGGEA